ncbi:MAG: hypothetical protein RL685_6696, partial [Pseudomonadota bacterium]
AFLDPAPLEERRTQAVMTRRFFDPKSARDLGALDTDAIERVRREAWPEFASADELADALYLCGFYSRGDLEQRVLQPSPVRAQELFDELRSQGRATRLVLPSGSALWVAAERLAQLLAVCPGARPEPELALPAALAAPVAAEDAWKELMRARLESLGPVTVRALVEPLFSLGAATAPFSSAAPDAALRGADQALGALEGQGSAMVGRFTPGAEEHEWCERGLLARIHRYTLERLRREIEPVTTAVFLRFLFAWQRVAPEHRQLGQAALPDVLAQLQGFEAAAGSWESALLPARVADYDPSWLDGLCLSGQLVWGRAHPPASSKALRSLATTPLVLALREDWGWLCHDAAERSSEPDANAPALELSANGQQIEEQLRRTGPRFFHDLRRTVATATELELALSELVAAGRISSDSFSGMRGLLPNKRRQRPGRRTQRRAPAGLESAGRWALLEALEAPPPDQVERWARLLLRRYGVVFRTLLERENAPPWRDLLREYRRLEARGEVRGGRFVQRHAGEQFALPEAVPLLRSERRSSARESAARESAARESAAHDSAAGERAAEERAGHGQEVCLSACDPLNLLGTLLPGERITAAPSNLILFRDGLPLAALESGKVRVFESLEDGGAERIGARLRRGPSAFVRPEGSYAALLPLRLGSRRAS